VRDDRPFGGRDPPAAAYFYSPDRSGSHAETWLGGYAGIIQADAFSGFGRLYELHRKPGVIIEAACWAEPARGSARRSRVELQAEGHARRKFFELAELQKAPIAVEAVSRIDAIFAVEREINGRSPEERRAARAERSRPLVEALGTWLRANRARLSPGQGMHGSFSRADTAVTGGAIGPDFRTHFSDAAPTSNADLGKTMARILRLDVPDVGHLVGRVLEEAMPDGALPAWRSRGRHPRPTPQGG